MAVWFEADTEHYFERISHFRAGAELTRPRRELRISRPFDGGRSNMMGLLTLPFTVIVLAGHWIDDVKKAYLSWGSFFRCRRPFRSSSAA